jgi:tetratricopeptide (TPR) repeat protein
MTTTIFRIFSALIFAASLQASVAFAAEPAQKAPPEDIYQRIDRIERVPPAKRTNAERVTLGRDYRNTGRLNEALTQAIDALAAQPEDGDALMLLGDLQFQRAEYVQALASFDHVAKLRPNDADVQLRRSQVLSAMGKSREAEAANALHITLRGQRAARAK